MGTEDDEAKDYVASFSEKLAKEIKAYGISVIVLLAGILAVLVFIAQKGF